MMMMMMNFQVRGGQYKRKLLALRENERRRTEPTRGPTPFYPTEGIMLSVTEWPVTVELCRVA